MVEGKSAFLFVLGVERQKDFIKTNEPLVPFNEHCFTPEGSLSLAMTSDIWMGNYSVV